MRCLSRVPFSKEVILLIWRSDLNVVALLGGRSSWTEPLLLKAVVKTWMASPRGHRHSTGGVKAKFWVVAETGLEGDLYLNSSCAGVCIVQKGFWCSWCVPKNTNKKPPTSPSQLSVLFFYFMLSSRGKKTASIILFPNGWPLNTPNTSEMKLSFIISYSSVVKSDKGVNPLNHSCSTITHKAGKSTEIYILCLRY